MQNIERNVMKAIKMNLVELLDIVRANKEKHIIEYDESILDYKKLVAKVASENTKIAREDSINKIFKPWPTTPVSYEDSYKRAIRMLELSVDKIIEVEEDIFNQLVLDEWSWKRSFTANTTSYKAGISLR
jgi:hypothetical protein